MVQISVRGISASPWPIMTVYVNTDSVQDAVMTATPRIEELLKVERLNHAGEHGKPYEGPWSITGTNVLDYTHLVLMPEQEG